MHREKQEVPFPLSIRPLRDQAMTEGISTGRKGEIGTAGRSGSSFLFVMGKVDR